MECFQRPVQQDARVKCIAYCIRIHHLWGQWTLIPLLLCKTGTGWILPTASLQKLFHIHVLSVNYQAAIWRCCLVSQPAVPDPKTRGCMDHRWRWQTRHGCVKQVLHMMSCKCTCVYKLPDLRCPMNTLKGTNMCKLETCTNQKEDDEDEVAEVQVDD